MLDVDQFRPWLGRTAEEDFTVDPWPAAAMSAALDRDDAPAPGEPLPAFWHHLYGLPVVRADRTGPDGHPARGDFLPPVPLPRRMWAGGRLSWPGEIRIGDRVSRLSTVRSIDMKSGRQGPLVFVLVEHRFSVGGEVRLVEEHDIVYREPPPKAAGAAGPPAGQAEEASAWTKSWTPDAVLLFRYSALTYNGHRIHYDHPYVTEVEGYPGLIVHGPLIATLMLDLLRREGGGRRIAAFDFRATAPLFADETMTVHGAPGDDGGVALRVIGPAGRAVMQGRAVLA